MTDEDAERGGPTSTWGTIALWVLGLLGVAVLAALLLTLREANHRRDDALAAQRHSYDVMILVRTLQGTIARSEASLGRYVISGDQQLGRLYFEDWRRADETIDRLEKLTHDNAVQSRHLGEIRDAFRERGDELALTALNTNYRKNNQALARFYHSSKADSLTRINEGLDALVAQERVLLEARTSHAQASVRRSSIIAKVLAAFGLLLVVGVIWLGWAVVSALSEHAVARAEADAQRDRAEELASAVAQATEELRAQEARLRQIQKMEAVGQLTGGIAHDFNNMLAVVLGGIELAQRAVTIDPKTAARHLSSAHDGAQRAAALTQQLLAFARETAINPEPIAAAPLFEGLADLIGRTLGDGVTVRFGDESDGWCTRADRVQLENSLVNLAVNARDAMEGRGTLTIRALRRTVAGADYVALAVSDTGCGMTPDVVERVFEPFFTTKPVGKGTGLGLSQVFSFARGLGGDVSVDSVVGLGTTVTLLLPRERAQPTASAPLMPVSAAPVAPVQNPAGLHILVVEDDPRVLPATMDALSELGHHPRACDDPTRAAALLAGMDRVDLILSDVLMPTLTGPEMVAELAATHARVPVLFVTGFAGGADEAIDLGGHPVLRKPFTLAGLERAVAQAAAARREARAAA
ncbi:ATP-binding protein [Sphingomonas sp. BK069]|uniref:ATP-binding protein n=1 Tax=Sphingomonas sp. BK069 TaxID=2586979 RepID=UPI00161D7840|nr:ATP-binding protein [Sphingomonas sp. BK069]MBB3347487.1 signal transduction histidine kinase/CheY-like chemotaxis protein [Sphingomonas sp. BK069]